MDDEDFDEPFQRYDSENEDYGDEKKSEKVTNTDESTVVPVPVRKRIVRNPRLKFDAERLCGDRGIPVLVNHFKDVKFKGKGYEKEDLDKLLATLEHWTHRLFPSMKFVDCLRQIEKLGRKRPVQTCLRKIRLDMPILSGDFVGDDEDREKESRQTPEPEARNIDPFDTLFAQSHQEETVQQVVTTPSPNQSVGHILGSTFGSNLTEEQKKRMEYNRMLAAERRKAKLSAVQLDLNSALDDSINLSESKNNETSLNEASSPTKSTHSSSDIFQSSSSRTLEPESESLLQSNEKNHSSDFQNSQEFFVSPIDQNTNKSSTFAENLISKKNCVPSPKKLCVDSQNDDLGMESCDSSALSQSILQVNDVHSNSEATVQNIAEIPSTSKGIIDIKEDSDELKMDELMDLIDE